MTSHKVILPSDFFEQLRQQIRVSDIVRRSVMLTKRSNEYSGLCPFHSEKTPSFTVNDIKRFYHCFGCGAHGDVIRFYSETSGLSYKESAIEIAKENGIEIPRLSKQEERRFAEEDYLLSLLEQAQQFFVRQIDERAEQYLYSRGVSKQMIRDFGLGYSPGRGALLDFFNKKSVKTEFLLKAGLVREKENGKLYELFNDRIIFPINNIYNKIVGFGGRVMDDSLPKYINSPETTFFKKSEIMYGENWAASAAHRKNRSILVEGYMDVIALQAKGYKETVASLGTAVTEKHLLKLWRFGDEILACLDGDSAGIKAGQKLIGTAIPHIDSNKRLSFVTLADGMDPDDYIKGYGAGEFEKILARRNSLSKQIWISQTNGKDFSSPEDKAELEKKLCFYTNQIKDKSLARNFQNYFKEQLWQLVKKNRNNNRDTGYRKEIAGGNRTVPTVKNYSELEVLEKGILSFLIRYPMLLSDSLVLDEMRSISFTVEPYADIFDWLLELTFYHAILSREAILEQAKNSGFSEIISVLSDPGEVFLEFKHIDRDIGNAASALLLLRRRHFLEQLKKEYSEVARDGSGTSESRARYYINEIRQVSLEIRQMTNSFIN